MQLVLLGIHEVSNIDGYDIAICDNQQMGMRKVSRILENWKIQCCTEMFHGICGPQFRTSDVDTELLQKCFDIVLTQYTVKETKSM